MGIEQQICDAIQIIVDKSISSAGFDRTIKATVEECLDAATGKYKLEYQDTYIIAYSPDIQYPEGTLVNVTIPNNDMAALKTILSAASYDTVPYSSMLNLEDKYKVIGQSVVIGSPTIELNGYENKNITLYQYGSATNKISLTDIKELQEYMREADSFSISAEIQTTLPLELQKDGDYGIVAVLSFVKEDNISEFINIPYVFNTTYINGNPYLLIDFIKQNAFFDIDGSKFDHIERIVAFTTNFPNTVTKNSNPNIFLKNFEIKALQEYDEADLEGGLVKLVSRTGLTFSNKDADSDFKEIEAHMLMNLKETTTNLRFFWFKENGAITSADEEKYNAYGGSGWECLNSKNRFTLDGAFIEEGEALPASYIVEWIPFTGNTLTVRKDSITTRKQAFKCVVIFDEVPYEEEIVITNFDSPYYVEIESDSGVKFFNGYGSPTLECILYRNGVKVTDLTNFEFVWTDSDMNDSSFVINGANLGDAKFNVVPGVKNKIEAHIAAISNYHTYRCSVVETVNGERISRGENSIQILNSESDTATYSLYIKHGQQVFKYNNDNIAPTSESLEDPMKLKPLTFSFFDPEGREVPAADIIKMGGKITWKVPTDTMLIILNTSPNLSMSNGEYSCYTNVGTLPYEISPTYQAKNYRNNITLEVEYQGVLLSATTEFSFFKDGDPGTNGTEFVCRLLPNKDTDEYPTLRVNKTGTILGGNFKNGVVTNHDSSSTNVNTSWFKAELWQGYKKVNTWYMNQDDGAEWYMMNIKDGVVKGFSDYEVRDSSYLYYNKTTELATNILKVEVEHQGKIYTAVSPILTATVADNSYDIKLKSGTGFLTAMYMEDGTYPSYNDSYPFEIEVTKNGTKLDINSSDYTVTWDIINGGERFLRGSYLDSDTFLYKIDEVDTTILANYRAMMLETPEESRELVAKTNFYGVALPNRRKIAPVAEFSSESTSNAIKVTVYQGSTEIASLHIPIYLYLNSFGKNAIDGWDGNSVTIGDDYFLAPQVGAGTKDEYNRYTGLLMGEVKYADGSNADIGLVGYNENTRTIFLDAQTGSAEFGHGLTSIKISPGVDGANAILSGGGFREGKNGRGLEINLSAPTIKYGSGKFSIDENGIMRATGAHFTDGTLSIGGTETNPVFSVTPQGVMTMTQGSITLGVNNSKSVFSVTDEGILTMTRGSITLGGTETAPNFKVTDSGVLTMKTGSISLGTNSNSATGYNFDVQNDGTLTLTKGSISLGYNSTTKKYNFTVANNGELTIKRGSISLGEITDGKGNVTDYKFKVTNNGQMTMTNGSISLGKQTDGSYNFSVNNSGQLKIYNGSIKLGKQTDGSYSFSVNNEGQGNFGVWKFTNSKMSADDLTSGGTFDLDVNGIKITDGTNEIFKATRTGGVLGYWKFTTTGIENSDKDISLSSSGLKIGSYVSISKNGSFTMGDETGKKFIKFDATDKSFTLGSGITLTWGAISDAKTKLSQFDNDTDFKNGSQVTSITKDTVTTAYVNALAVTAGSVSADNITAGTINGSTIGLSTQLKVSTSATDYCTMTPGEIKLKAGDGNVTGTISTDSDSITFNKRITVGSSGNSLVYCGTLCAYGGHVETDYLDAWRSGNYRIRVTTSSDNGGIQGEHLINDDAKTYGWHYIAYAKWSDGSTHFPNRSDRRCKTNIQDLSNEECLYLLQNIKSKIFNYKNLDGGEPNIIDVNCGFIAQDVRDALINGGIGYRTYLQIHQKGNDEEGEYINDIYADEDKVGYFLEYEKMIPIVWKGWQIHNDEISLLKQEIQELKNKLKEAGIE